LLKSRFRPINVVSVDLTRIVIICSKHKKVDEITAECLKHTEGPIHEYVAIDTDTNEKPLRETDRQRLSKTTMRLLDVLALKEGCKSHTLPSISL